MNTKRGVVSFEANGSVHSLAFTMNNMVRYQDASGETLLAACASMERDPGNMARLRRMFWAGLGDPTMTEDAAGELMDALGMGECIGLIAKAAEAAFPQAEAGAETGNGKGSKKTR